MGPTGLDGPGIPRGPAARDLPWRRGRPNLGKRGPGRSRTSPWDGPGARVRVDTSNLTRGEARTVPNNPRGTVLSRGGTLVVATAEESPEGPSPLGPREREEPADAPNPGVGRGTDDFQQGIPRLADRGRT